MKCKICEENSEIKKLKTYKHFWYFCNKCKNLFSKPRKIKNNIILKFIIKIIIFISGQKRLGELLLCSNNINYKFYGYYKDIILKNYTGKWKKYDSDFIKYLKKNKVQMKNKSILSVSDEPGFVTKLYKQFTNDITLTALNKEVTKFMKKKYGCDVKTYDMNKNKLSKIVRKKYDLIFFRSTLNFNYNFKSLVYEIKNLSKKNTICIFNFYSPSVSSCLMWMFDDYTLNSLVREKYIIDLLGKDFKIIKKTRIYENPREIYYNSLIKKIFYYPFFLYYFLNYKYDYLNGKFDLKFNRNQEFNKLILRKT